MIGFIFGLLVGACCIVIATYGDYNEEIEEEFYKHDLYSDAAISVHQSLRHDREL